MADSLPSPRTSLHDDTPLRSPVGSFTCLLASKAKPPGTLILGSPEPDNQGIMARKGSGSFNGASPRPAFSPKPGKHEDPMLAWPMMCPSPEAAGPAAALSPSFSLGRAPSPDTLGLSPRRSASMSGTAGVAAAAATIIGHQRKASAESAGDAISPRRHSLPGLAIAPTVIHASCGHGSGAPSPSQHSVPAPLIHTPIHSASTAATSLDQRCSALLCGADSSEGSSVSTADHSIAAAGGPAAATAAATAAAACSEALTGKQRMHWAGTSQLPQWPKPQAPAAGGEFLQSQTHAALQQLSIKQPVKRRESEQQLHAAEGEVQRWSLKRGGEGNIYASRGNSMYSTHGESTVCRQQPSLQ